MKKIIKDYSIVDTAIVECYDYAEINNFIRNNIMPLFKNNTVNFKSYLDGLIKDAKEAIEQTDTAKATNIWCKQFGERFK